MKNNKEFNKVVDIYIFTVIFLIILFYKSVRDLIEIFSYGILKKETLKCNSFGRLQQKV